MVENKSYVSKKEFEKLSDKSEEIERILEGIKESLEKLEIVVEKLEEECLRSTYKNVEFGYRIERLEGCLKTNKKMEDNSK
jgi:predicted transcriptional regulator